MTNEKTMEAVLGEVMAELPIRRQLVQAEVLAQVVAAMDKMETCPLGALVEMASKPGNTYRDAIEANLIKHGAEILLALVDIAFRRGAGVAVEDDEASIELGKKIVAAKKPGEVIWCDDPARVTSQPPATADGLGHREGAD